MRLQVSKGQLFVAANMLSIVGCISAKVSMLEKGQQQGAAEQHILV